MTNVLLPTDFTTNSIAKVSGAVEAISGKLNIFLFHAFDIPDSLADAMQRAGRHGHSELITERLRLKCKQVKAAHPNISNISFRVMYGTTTAAFKNFAEANKIDTIYIPKGHKFVAVVRESVNYDRMFRKSGIQIINDANTKNLIVDPETYLKAVTQPLPLYNIINN
jgi:hypothetical protein